MKRRLIFSPIALLPILLLSGCATSRGIVDLNASTDEAEARASVATNAPVVYIGQITDDRSFELKPRDASIPSLKDGQIENVELTSRAIARKRNGYGMALGDVLLPEDRTVTDVVRENVAQVLNEGGYRVVDSAQDGAPSVDISINQFWSWFTPGFFVVKIEFRSKLIVSGGLPGFKDSETIEGYAHQRHQVAGSGAWIQTMQAGLEDLRKNFAARLQPAR